jgi:hypothetical protein
MSTDFLVQTYGLALFLIARGIQPTSATRAGNGMIFVFPPEARTHFDAFQLARKQLTALQASVGFDGNQR